MNVPAAVMRERNLPTLLCDAQAAAKRLAIVTDRWPVFMPGTSGLDDACNVVEGLRRTLGELRIHTENMK